VVQRDYITGKFGNNDLRSTTSKQLLRFEAGQLSALEDRMIQYRPVRDLHSVSVVTTSQFCPFWTLVRFWFGDLDSPDQLSDESGSQGCGSVNVNF